LRDATVHEEGSSIVAMLLLLSSLPSDLRGKLQKMCKEQKEKRRSFR
jgi:hypothetical protein